MGFPDRCCFYVPPPWRRPSPEIKFCCEAMHKAVVEFCDEHDDPWACPHALVVYNEPLDEYGIVMRDGDPEYVIIRHCPWCAAALPKGRRDDWFEALEARGYIDLVGRHADELPEEFRTARWRQEA